MRDHLFVVILTYIVPLEQIDLYKAQHLEFLDHYYSKGVLIVSGPQVPRTGGVLLAKCSSREKLEQILAEDPFAINGLAEYKIHEFEVTKFYDKIIL